MGNRRFIIFSIFWISLFLGEDCYLALRVSQINNDEGFGRIRWALDGIILRARVNFGDLMYFYHSSLLLELLSITLRYLVLPTEVSIAVCPSDANLI